jgi:hypothetical protein
MIFLPFRVFPFDGEGSSDDICIIIATPTDSSYGIHQHVNMMSVNTPRIINIDG